MGRFFYKQPNNLNDFSVGSKLTYESGRIKTFMGAIQDAENQGTAGRINFIDSNEQRELIASLTQALRVVGLIIAAMKTTTAEYQLFLKYQTVIQDLQTEYSSLALPPPTRPPHQQTGAARSTPSALHNTWYSSPTSPPTQPAQVLQVQYHLSASSPPPTDIPQRQQAAPTPVVANTNSWSKENLKEIERRMKTKKEEAAQVLLAQQRAQAEIARSTPTEAAKEMLYNFSSFWSTAESATKNVKGSNAAAEGKAATRAK